MLTDDLVPLGEVEDAAWLLEMNDRVLELLGDQRLGGELGRLGMSQIRARRFGVQLPPTGKQVRGYAQSVGEVRETDEGMERGWRLEGVAFAVGSSTRGR
eukprot:6375044-Lingulodinium_polyedra.AAC.1